MSNRILKYSKIGENGTREIIKVKDFFVEVKPFTIARALNMHVSYLYRVRDGVETISEKQFNRLAKAKEDILAKRVDTHNIT